MRKHKRYKLLLDEGLHLPTSYPKLNNLHDLLHIANTHHRGKGDSYIYKLAQKEERIPVVFNTKHFKPLVKQDSISIIALSTNIKDAEADRKICKVLRSLKANQIKGHLISISNEGVSIMPAE